MKGNLKLSALAAAIATLAIGTAAAVPPADVTTSIDTDITVSGDVEAVGEVAVGGELLVGGDITIDYDYDYDDNFTRNVDIDRNFTRNHTENHTENTTINTEVNQTVDSSLSSDVSLTESHNVETNQEYSSIVKLEYGRTDVRGERDEHGVSVNIDKSLSLDSDISFSGEPTLSGDIEIDSAAIAVIDNRQAITDNTALNQLVTNDASADGDVGSAASGNLQFNIAAGDNNVQDNAAALSAADASFSFGLADAEVFVNQYGAGNTTMNYGVTNAASMAGNAFSDAAGNIGVNVASGNNNQQKNALAASVATSAYAQSSVSSNQVSTGNAVSNQGYVRQFSDTVDVELTGTVSGLSLGMGIGAYEGSASGRQASRGNAYQQDNFYLDNWDGDLDHPHGDPSGHLDMDDEIQNAVDNPYRDGVGGIAFDTDSAGSYQGSESGEMEFLELSYSDLQASLAGTMTTTQWVAVDHSNTASLSGSAFARASGNIGVNLAAGSGNLQANSLAMAVAQPSTGGGDGGGGE